MAASLWTLSFCQQLVDPKDILQTVDEDYDLLSFRQQLVDPKDILRTVDEDYDIARRGR